ncbi:MAG: hypothetical protein IPL58_14825 [Betaproteobacteria bacterium]|uniref:Uncharacterized protein n=1 Tax=Candidatus Proximibacter danicus TaxID=2954365 RepID=A0A9D7K486_9PROT|nr:hypothetical protein [Candidatus Proximibacter danicus]
MRQTLSNAYNDISGLNDQLSFIGIQVSLVQKRETRIATSSTSASALARPAGYPERTLQRPAGLW